MKKNLMFCVCCIIVLVACKKTTTTTSSNPNNNTPSATITTAPATQSFFNAYLNFYASQTIINKTTGQSSWLSYADAAFNNNTATVNGTYVKVNSILLNNTALQYDTAVKYYYSTNGSGSASSWVVNGLNNIPSFSYSAKMPTCLNLNTFPDTIDHTKPFSLFVKYDMASQIITYLHVSAISMNSSSVNTDTTTLYYSASQMNAVPVGTATIDITAAYSDNILVNGVPMAFYSKIDLLKTVYVK